MVSIVSGEYRQFSPAPISPLSERNTHELFVVLIVDFQMARKRGGFPLKKELDSLSYLQSFPYVQKRFTDAGCMNFVEKLQEGHHTEVAEMFAKSYDRRNAIVGSLNFIVDEGAIAIAIGIPRTGEI